MEGKIDKFVIGDETYKAIYMAATKMYLLVGSTMGPKGGTIVIPDSNEYGKYKITKDGVSVAKTVKSEDKYEQVIIDLIKEIASNTVRIAGDGTTTSIVLTYYFLTYLSKMGIKNIDFNLFDKKLEEVLEYLDEVKKELKPSNIQKVALIAANGDSKVADLINEAYSSSKVVHVERSNKDEDSLEVIKGLYVPSNKIVGRGKVASEVELKDGIQLVAIDQNITKLSFIEDLLKTQITTNKGKALIIVTNHVDETILNTVAINNREGKTNVHFIKSPGFSTQRTKLLNDIAKYAGCELVDETCTKITNAHIGSLTSVNIKSNKSYLYNEDSNISELIKDLNKQLKDAPDEHEVDLLNQRLDRLKGLSIIRVGAKSEAEMNEKYDRYEDAVLAVACALEEGVVEGGGLALGKYARQKLTELNYNPENAIKDPAILFYLALTGPLETIAQNGADIKIDSDLIIQHIYDPVKVTKTALIQAYNFSKLLFTTRGIILTNDGNFSV